MGGPGAVVNAVQFVAQRKDGASVNVEFFLLLKRLIKKPS